MHTDFEKIREIFFAIVAQPSAQWEALCNEACGTDAHLRQQVAVLLEAHAESEGILDRNQVGQTQTGAQGQRISISLNSQYFGEKLAIETAPNHLAS